LVLGYIILSCFVLVLKKFTGLTGSQNVDALLQYPYGVGHDGDLLPFTTREPLLVAYNILVSIVLSCSGRRCHTERDIRRIWTLGRIFFEFGIVPAMEATAPDDDDVGFGVWIKTLPHLIAHMADLFMDFGGTMGSDTQASEAAHRNDISLMYKMASKSYGRAKMLEFMLRRYNASTITRLTASCTGLRVWVRETLMITLVTILCVLQT
jgi:hypothetical protein